MVPFWFNRTANNPQYRIDATQKTEGRIIASLTTFPARIDNIWIVIESILRQSQKPDMLFLWLSKEQFSSIDVLPKRLQNLQTRGLQIRLCDGDLRSHKKYYYVLRDYPNDHLITFDDDLIYPTNTISSIMEAATMYPDCVVGRYSNQVGIDDSGNVRLFSIKIVTSPFNHHGQFSLVAVEEHYFLLAFCLKLQRTKIRLCLFVEQQMMCG